MTRPARVAVELLAPPLLGSSPFLFMAIVTGSFRLFPLVLLVAYAIAIVPSAIFATLLELAFWSGLAPRSPRAILLGGFLGLAAGVALGAATGVPTVVEKALTLGFLGTTVGTGTSLLVWRWSAPAEVRAPPDVSDRSGPLRPGGREA